MKEAKINILGSPYEIPVELDRDDVYYGGLQPLSMEELEEYLPPGWWDYYGKWRSAEHLEQIAEYYGTMIMFTYHGMGSNDPMVKYYLHAWSWRAAEWLGVKDPDHIGDAKLANISFALRVYAELRRHKRHWVQKLEGMVAFKIGERVYITPPPFISLQNDMMHSLQEPAIKWVNYFTRKVVAYSVAANNRIVDVRYYNGTVDGLRLWQQRLNFEIAAAAIQIMLARQDVDKCLDLVEVDRAKSRSGGTFEEIVLYKSTTKVIQVVKGEHKWAPLHLVRIVCPSTGRVYFVPVEPVFDSAIEAIKSTQPEAIRRLRPGDEYFWHIAT